MARAMRVNKEIFAGLLVVLSAIAGALFCTNIVDKYLCYVLKYGTIVSMLELMIFVFFYLFIITTYMAIFRKIFSLPQKAEYHSISLPPPAVWQHYLVLCDWTISLFGYVLPVGIRPLFYRILGAKIGRDVIIGGKLIEPHLVTIEDYVTIGESAVISPHSIEGDKIIIAPIHVETNATIGIHATLLPGVLVGHDALVGAGATVTKYKNVPPYSIWVDNRPYQKKKA